MKHAIQGPSRLRQPNLLPFSASRRCYPGNLGIYPFWHSSISEKRRLPRQMPAFGGNPDVLRTCPVRGKIGTTGHAMNLSLTAAVAPGIKVLGDFGAAVQEGAPHYAERILLTLICHPRELFALRK